MSRTQLSSSTRNFVLREVLSVRLVSCTVAVVVVNCIEKRWKINAQAQSKPCMSKCARSDRLVFQLPNAL